MTDITQQIGCPEAESALLGALMLQAAGTDLDSLLVEPTDLVDPRGRLVVGAIRRLVAQGARPDLVTALGELRSAGS